MGKPANHIPVHHHRLLDAMPEKRRRLRVKKLVIRRSMLMVQVVGGKGGAKACRSSLAFFTIATVELEDQARQSAARLLGLHSRRSGLRTMVSDFGTRWWLLLQRLDFSPKTQQLRRAYSHRTICGVCFREKGNQSSKIVGSNRTFATLVSFSQVRDEWQPTTVVETLVSFLQIAVCRVEFW
nr:hypothetical protein Iba_scaffold979177CG0010 [Ipomoea batatas]